MKQFIITRDRAARNHIHRVPTQMWDQMKGFDLYNTNIK